MKKLLLTFGLLVAIFAPHHAFAAVAIDTQSFQHPGTIGATSHSLSYTPGATASLLLITINIGQAGETISSVTWNGAAMSLISTFSCTNEGVSPTYGIVSPATGAHTLVVTYNATLTTSGIYYFITSYSGTKTSGLPTNFSNGTGGPAVSSFTTSLTTTVANSWIYLAGQNDVGPFTAGTGLTQRNTGAGQAGITGDSNGPLAIGSNSMSASWGAGGNFANTMIEIDPPSGAGGSVPGFGFLTFFSWF